MEENTELLELGIWLGRGQAFGLIANKCSAAQAQCLKTMREEGAHKSLNLSWEEFCRQRLGISRTYADHLIRQLDRFGAAYFELSQIMHISAETYGLIQEAVGDGCIEHRGERIPITSENAGRIKAAVQELRKESERARAARRRRTSPGIIVLQTRLDACFDEMGRMAGGLLDDCDRAGLTGLIAYSQNKLSRLAARLS